MKKLLSAMVCVILLCALTLSAYAAPVASVDVEVDFSKLSGITTESTYGDLFNALKNAFEVTNLSELTGRGVEYVPYMTWLLPGTDDPDEFSLEYDPADYAEFFQEKIDPDTKIKLELYFNIKTYSDIEGHIKYSDGTTKFKLNGKEYTPALFTGWYDAVTSDATLALEYYFNHVFLDVNLGSIKDMVEKGGGDIDGALPTGDSTPVLLLGAMLLVSAVGLFAMKRRHC